MDITVVTTATNDDEGRALLRALGFPVQGELEMAKKALVQKAAKKPKFAVRGYTAATAAVARVRCSATFGLCRICVREMAHAGQLPASPSPPGSPSPPSPALRGPPSPRHRSTTETVMRKANRPTE
jgi:ribosomal protein S14